MSKATLTVPRAKGDKRTSIHPETEVTCLAAVQPLINPALSLLLLSRSTLGLDSGSQLPDPHAYLGSQQFVSPSLPLARLQTCLAHVLFPAHMDSLRLLLSLPHVRTHVLRHGPAMPPLQGLSESQHVTISCALEQEKPTQKHLIGNVGRFLMRRYYRELNN